MVAKKLIYTRKVSISRTGSHSVRTTVPLDVAKVLELSDRDSIDWEMEPKGDVYLVTVKKHSQK